MLPKHQAATVILRSSRITLSSTVTHPASPSIPSNTANMTTAETSVRTHHSPRPSSDSYENVKQSKPERPPAGAYFPLGYKDAAYQWWTSITPPMVERSVLNLIPHLREATDSLANLTSLDKADPFGMRVWRRRMVQLSGKGRALNEVSIERVGEEEEETVVMVHGYGAGLGFFYKNFEPLSRVQGVKLYALDMLGMGNSTRPPFKIHAKTKEEQVVEAENWFIDALEEWRQARKIERFTLLGHSLGGYLAVSYAIKYPGHLKKLILASPVGIPKDPYAVNASMPDPEESTMTNEFIQDQHETTEAHGTATIKAQKETKGPPNAPKRPYPGWLTWLWDQNVSPFSFVRMTGPFGPRLVSGWSSRRFNHLPADEAQALHDYSFSIFKQKGSGEYALAYILAPGAYARRPVIDRIQEVGRQTISTSADGQAVKEHGLPIVFMYGENDWMDAAGGLAAEEKLKQTQRQVLLNGTDEEKRLEKGSTKVVIVPKAGHHLYLDNPDNFNKVVTRELEKTRDEGREQRAAAAASPAI